MGLAGELAPCRPLAVCDLDVAWTTGRHGVIGIGGVGPANLALGDGVDVVDLGGGMRAAVEPQLTFAVVSGEHFLPGGP
jgi:hypothetical protein